MLFDPKTNKFPYPLYTDEHYLKVKKNDGTVFDEKYPYIDNSKSFKRSKFFFNIPYYGIAIPFALLRLGLKVKGRKNSEQTHSIFTLTLPTFECNYSHKQRNLKTTKKD